MDSLTPPVSINSEDNILPSFQNELVRLLKMLEEWRRERVRIENEDPNEFPETDWKQMRLGLLFAALGWVLTLNYPWVNNISSAPYLYGFLTTLTLCVLCGIAVMLKAAGFFSGRAWKASMKKQPKPENYPFTTVSRRLTADFEELPKMASFSAELLNFACSRLRSDEADLRDRLTNLIGNSPAVLVFSLVAGIWSSMKTFEAQLNLFSLVVLLLAVVGVVLSIYGLNLRFLLLELTRCRSLIELELAARKARG